MNAQTARTTGWDVAEPEIAIGSAAAWRHRADFGWVLAGKLALVGVNALVMLILANWLSREVYGLLVVTIGAQLVLSRGLMLGIGSAVMRFSTAPGFLERERDIAWSGLAVIASTSGLVVLGAVIVGSVLGPTAGPPWVLTAIVAGAIGTALVDYTYCLRLARVRYCAAALVQSSAASGRLFLTTAVAALWPHREALIFLTYGGTTLLAGLAHMVWSMPRGRGSVDPALVSRLLRYSFWTALVSFLGVLGLYQGAFLLRLLGHQAATGLFGLGLTLSLGFSTVYTAFNEYLLSRVVRVQNVAALRRFLAGTLPAGLVAAIACVPAIVAVAILVPSFVPPELRAVPTVFYWFAASVLLLMVQAPLEATCHWLMRPHLILVASTLRLGMAVLLGLSLVPWEMAPLDAAMRMATAQFAGGAVAAVGLAVLVAGKLRS